MASCKHKSRGFTGWPFVESEGGIYLMGKRIDR